MRLPGDVRPPDASGQRSSHAAAGFMPIRGVPTLWRRAVREEATRDFEKYREGAAAPLLLKVEGGFCGVARQEPPFESRKAASPCLFLVRKVKKAAHIL